MTDSPFPIRFQWDGEAMRPATKFWAREADKRYTVGETYTMDEIFVRSHATHAHYFAVIKAAWESLPDELRPQYPSAEHLRKLALIHSGYSTMVQHVAKSGAEAERLASIIKPYDTYQLVMIDPEKPTVVTVYHAQSQDHRSMDKQRFQESKEAVLRWIGELIGADPTELRNAA
jgi:hypothetical protein